jgi:hypothetical protein
MSMYRTRYFVTFPDQPELEVSLTDWCRAERAAGFHGPEGHAATGGFSGNGISGRITYGLEGETPEPGGGSLTGRLRESQPNLQSLDPAIERARERGPELPASVPELELEGKVPEDGWDELQDAIDLASDQDTVTWLTRDGRRVAAIVPADVAGDHERRIAEVLPVIRHHRQPHGEITERLVPPEHLSLENPPPFRLDRDRLESRFLFPGQVQLLPGQAGQPYELDPDRLRELLPDVPVDRKIPLAEEEEPAS